MDSSIVPKVNLNFGGKPGKLEKEPKSAMASLPPRIFLTTRLSFRASPVQAGGGGGGGGGIFKEFSLRYRNRDL